jgi:hypothetical protein
MYRSNAVRWIKEQAEEIPPPDPKTAENTSEPDEVIELDEMFHYVKKSVDRNKGKCVHNSCRDTESS